jgi:spermidine/putrescine-binding protein
VTDQKQTIDRLLDEATSRRWSRRQVITRGMALGLSVPVIQSALASGAFAQDATPGASPAAPAGTPVSPAANGPVNVPIVGKSMSFDDIKAAIQSEGEVNVGNWTYSANDQLVARFQDYVKQVYDVDIKLNYAGTQTPQTYLTDLYAAAGAGENSPYDVLAIEENYWAAAQEQAKTNNTKLMEDYLPSGLIPNADRVLDNFKHAPTSIGFQASATPGINYHSSKVDFLKDWKDLADPRLKGKLLMWLPTDITAGGFLMGLADSLGKDWKNADQMKEVIDFAVDQIGPNAIKYTSDNSDVQGLFQSGVADVVMFWNSEARLMYLNGVQDASFLVAASGQYMVNGYMWIPVKPKHPVLAQIFIDWRLGDDAQFPDIDAWGITKGAWAELQEGLMGPSYEKDIPDWIKADYYNFYPTIDQLSTNYKQVDWTAYNANSKDWFDYYSQKLGL